MRHSLAEPSRRRHPFIPLYRSALFQGVAIWCLACSAPQAVRPVAAAAEDALWSQARRAAPERYAFAQQHGAVLDTARGVHYLFWKHPASDGRVLVTLHGHASWALDEFFLWYPYAQSYRFSILALQWWGGGGETVEDYLKPTDMYPVIESVLREQGLEAGQALLHGFSRGSTNTYPLVALDRASGNRFFGGIIANSGGASADCPPIQAITRGDFGAQVFEGTRWVLFCGEQDPNPQRSGCPAMERAGRWIESLGGRTHLMVDASQGHGGFHRTEAHVRDALEWLGLSKNGPVKRSKDPSASH